jgi:dynein heavy chain 2
MDYPKEEDLVPVYSEIFQPILMSMGNNLHKSKTKLTQTILKIFQGVKAKFNVDEQRHYLFTPREVSSLVYSLLRYRCNGAQELIETLIYEAQRVFKDRLVDKESKKRFDNILYKEMKQNLNWGDRITNQYYISLVAKE